MNDDADDLPLLRPLRLPRGVPHEVSEMFEKLTLEVADRGLKKYSARAVLHRLRWHFTVDQGRRIYKINNRWSRSLADWVMEKHSPRLTGFFETRDRQKRGGDDA